METRIHVVFDYKHLLKEHRGLFKAFSKAAKGLVGYPVEQFLTERGLTRTHGTREADCAVFRSAKADDDTLEPPPLYTKVAGKRHQLERNSPSRASPPSKRICVTPQPETVSPADAYLGSTTEEATTTTAFPSSPRPSSDTHEAVGNILETKISHALHKILPGMLKAILDSNAKADCDAPTSIGAQITERVIADAEPRIAKLIKKIEEDISEHQEQLRRDAQAELDHDVSECKYEMETKKDETLQEIAHETETMTNDFLKAANERKQELSEELDAIANDLFLSSCERHEDTMEQIKMALQASAIKLEGNGRGEFWYFGSNVQPTRITQKGLRGVLLKYTLKQVVDDQIKLEENTIASPHESKACVRRRAESLPPL